MTREPWVSHAQSLFLPKSTPPAGFDPATLSPYLSGYGLCLGTPRSGFEPQYGTFFYLHPILHQCYPHDPRGRKRTLQASQRTTQHFGACMNPNLPHTLGQVAGLAPVSISPKLP